MNKLVLLLLLSVTVPTVYAQSTTGGDTPSGKTRAEVKAEERASGSLSNRNNEYVQPPSTKGSGKTKAERKADVRAHGTDTTKQDEYSDPASTKGSGTTRAQVKSEERASGSLGTKQDEYTDPPQVKRRKRAQQ